jgi:hypothetical protein
VNQGTCQHATRAALAFFDNWSDVCDEADLRETERSLLWGRQFLNPFTFEDLVREYAELAKTAGDVRKHLQNNA